MAEARRSPWRAALDSLLSFAASAKRLKASSESRELVFSSLKIWREIKSALLEIKGPRRLTCLNLSRLASEEEEVPWLFGAPEDLQILR